MEYLCAIISLLYASFEGAREAFYYDLAQTKEKQMNIHWMYFVQRSLVFLLIFALTDFGITAFAVFTFSFVHDGFYYYTRNKLNPAVYLKGFFDSSSTSTAVMEFSLAERLILAIFGLVFLLINIAFP